MKEIKVFEEARAAKCKNLREAGINPTMYIAYFRSKEDAGNELIDFSEVIWDEDVLEIVRTCRENDIREFTISSTMSSIIATIAEFEKLGCKMFGIMQINATYTDFMTGKKKKIPAIKMVL